MARVLVVSDRGQITLPASLRKRMGIRGGDVMLLDARQDEIVLRPAVVLEIERYDDEQIATWAAADQFDDEERERLQEDLRRR